MDETWLMTLPGKDKTVSLTTCWSTDEKWLMRLAGTGIKQYLNSPTVNDGWDMINEAAWQRNNAVLLTACWSSDETCQLMRLVGKWIKQYLNLQTVDHGWDMIDEAAEIKQYYSLPVGHESHETWLMRLPGIEIKYSHSVGHGMKHDWWDCLANNYAVSLTYYSIVGMG